MLLNYAAFEIEFQPALTHFRAATQVEVGVGVGCRAAGEGEEKEREGRSGQSDWDGKKEQRCEERQIVIYVILFARVTYTQCTLRIRTIALPLCLSLSRWVIPLVNLTAIKFAYISIKCRTLKSFARQANKAKCGV